MCRICVFILLFLLVTQSYAQNDSVIKYANGQPKYVLTYLDDSLKKNIYLSPGGDTIYKWDVSKAEIAEYPVTGQYLSRKEYGPFKKQLSKRNSERIENIPQINWNVLITPSSREWSAMYSIFFSRCRDYTEVIHEGPFTITAAYKNHVQSGAFKKFYNGNQVVSGQYLDGKKNGIWKYHPYYYYPYYDVTFFGYIGREWSFIYTILPLILILTLLIVAGKYCREEKYQYYFYAVIGLAILALSLRLGIPFDRENVWIRFFIPICWFTLWQTMIILAIVNLFFSGRKTNTHPLLNVCCLLIGLGFSVYVIFFKHLNF